MYKTFFLQELQCSVDGGRCNRFLSLALRAHLRAELVDKIVCAQRLVALPDQLEHLFAGVCQPRAGLLAGCFCRIHSGLYAMVMIMGATGQGRVDRFFHRFYQAKICYIITFNFSD